MSQPEVVNQPIRVGLLCASEQRSDDLRRLLEEHQLSVVVVNRVEEWFDRSFDRHQADVLLVDLDESGEHADEVLERLMETVSLPILFSEAAALSSGESGRRSVRRLAKKLGEIARAETSREQPEAVAIIEEPLKSEEPAQRPAVPIRLLREPDEGAAQCVWVLGASIGGPPPL
ncbi:hypothetical protein BOW53_01750 [Solemya pervernicosa gill symbiont]|uniref:Response regulatory domain-containing protein n=2 Tax=Gammaproteobacteria incertae sedis TaxID=118884 RepID=A0A1T2LA20_9GAMM|nr:hypothetical protein [Candidatus Reidiella endopervernicosa]OOZ41920.1 hypothetical protein BOW53_01750 [Solemya pervernicosa gill symbiont]QKQ24883.1 hypothetical protein HUE57_00220 [Candidatus Reidiella endopervernicosa]